MKADGIVNSPIIIQMYVPFAGPEIPIIGCRAVSAFVSGWPPVATSLVPNVTLSFSVTAGVNPVGVCADVIPAKRSPDTMLVVFILLVLGRNGVLKGVGRS